VADRFSVAEGGAEAVVEVLVKLERLRTAVQVDVAVAIPRVRVRDPAGAHTRADQRDIVTCVFVVAGLSLRS
jgi:hypothetical protein